MSTFSNRIRAFAAGAALTLMVTMPAFADDSEIYSADTPKGAEPNVLFIIDTSGSMDSEVEQTVAAYQPSTTYIGVCDDNYVYYSTGTTPPTCSLDSNSGRIPKSIFTCKAAAAALGKDGGGMYPGLGNAGVRAAQNRKNGKTYQWQQGTFNLTDYVECRDDNGIHGLDDIDTTNKYIKNGSSSSATGWGPTDASVWGGLTQTYYFYSANYVNWRYSAGSSQVTRLQIVRDVALSLASTLQNVKLGLMRYSSDAQGGYVVTPIGAISDTRTKIINDLKSFNPKDGNNGTPLSETLYEAALYLTGGVPAFGDKSSPGKSTDTTAVVNGKYVSPIEYSCQKSYIVYLTDGAPTVDHDANTLIPGMIGTAACAADTFPPDHDTGYTDGDGVCMDDLAKWMSSPDTDLNKDVTDNQQALTYMIGFGSGISDKSKKYLNMIANAGGTTNAYSAADVTTLTEALQTIFKKIQEDSGTFVTPSITVNAFNRSQTDQDLYYSLFKASNTTHWPGNLKKYRLGYDKTTKKDIIVDSKGINAVTSDGKFSPDAISFWSNPKDGEDITKGGAAGMQVAPADRILYTSLASKTLKGTDGNLIDYTKNTSLTDAKVGTGLDDTKCSDACKRAVDWLRGIDVNDENKNNDKTDQNKFMGDPLHGIPAVVTYGLLSDNKTSDNVVYVPTNDGLLHAINAADGKELWAYMPPELLGRLGNLSSKDVAIPRTYGLDGDVRVLRMDVNQNGVVDSGDRVWLFFGMRAGGNHYYGLDVTNRNEPTLLWNIGPNELPNVGQTWSAPVVARVNVNDGKDNDDVEKFVLIFGGGYDPQQELQAYSADTVGNRIFMVDASTGKRLWFAGATATTGDTTPPDLALDAAGQKMNNSIPARVTVIDTNGDLFADRMYVGDMGGRIWRFDIFNGKSKTDLVAGGVIAKLGDGDAATVTDADNRRFYNAVDVSLVDVRGRDPYYNLAVGSGYRGHPLNKVTVERFYSLHDDLPYVQMPKDQYASYKAITAADLIDVTPGATATTTPSSPRGWSLDMKASGSFAGEKVLSESTTVNNTVLFTSFEPGQTGGKKGACYPSTTNRAYSVSTLTGKINFIQEINQEGIVGGVNVAVKRGDDESTGGGSGGGDGDPLPPPPGSPPTICLVGTRVLDKCVDVGGTVRTWWNRADAQ